MKIAYPVILSQDGKYLMASSPDCKEEEVITLVDVDLESYKRKHEMRTVRKNLTLPFWLNEAAEKQIVNFSKILQEALMKHLNIDAPPYSEN